MGKVLTTDYFASTTDLIKERAEAYNINAKELGCVESPLTRDTAIRVGELIHLDYEVLLQYDQKYNNFVQLTTIINPKFAKNNT